MNMRRITDGVMGLGAVDWNRRLFDSLIPLPDGTSYNAYLVRGERQTALLDMVDPTQSEVLMEQLRSVPRLDYVVSHHAEQDHSGTIPQVLEHAEIMMPFRSAIRKNLAKVGALDARVIAPSHGPLYDRPAVILGAYEDWVSDAVKNEAVIAYVSMHGSTLRMVERLVAALEARAVRVHLFDLTVTDLGKLAMALVDAATLVVGTPTVHGGPHPAVFYASHLANALRPKLRFASIIGSYGWSSKCIDTIAGLIPNLQVEVLEPVLCRGMPQAQTYDALERLAAGIAERHAAVAGDWAA